MEQDDSITHRSFTVTCHSHRITTTVTANPTIIHDWISNTRSTYNHHIRRGRLVVGLGVQWQPTYNRRGTGPPATLQLCVGRNCLIIQLRHSPSVPDSLRQFLSDPSISFVGVGNHNDNPMLQSSRHNLSVSRLIEFRDVAAARWPGLLRNISMEWLAASVLGITDVNLKPDRVGRSDWEAYWLGVDQICYASIDAFISFLLGKVLEVWDWGKQNSEVPKSDKLEKSFKPGSSPLKNCKVMTLDNRIDSETKFLYLTPEECDKRWEQMKIWKKEYDEMEAEKTSKVSDGLNRSTTAASEKLDPVKNTSNNEKMIPVKITSVSGDEPPIIVWCHNDDYMVPTIFREDEMPISDPVELIRPCTSPLKNWSVTRTPFFPQRNL